jgi:hypothetical protein
MCGEREEGGGQWIRVTSPPPRPPPAVPPRRTDHGFGEERCKWGTKRDRMPKFGTADST